MKDDDLAVPTARECFAEAYRIMRGPGDLESAQMWLAMAREIREDAAMRRMWAPLPQFAAPPAEPVAEVRTLHDVEGIVCAHGKVALHWKDDDSADGWWHHAEDGTACDDPDQSGDAFRRRDQTMRERQGDGLPGQTMADTLVRPYAAGGIIDPVKWARATESSPLEVPGTNGPDLARPYVADADAVMRRTLLDEPVTAVMPLRLPEPPVDGDHATCRNHGELNGLVFADGAWRHEVNMQTLCPIAGQTPEGDETYHHFANPL